MSSSTSYNLSRRKSRASGVEHNGHGHLLPPLLGGDSMKKKPFLSFTNLAQNREHEVSSQSDPTVLYIPTVSIVSRLGASSGYKI